MGANPPIEHAGDRRHPDYQKYLLALGSATYAAALVTGAMLDIARVHAGVDYWDIVSKRLTMGQLRKELEKKIQSVPGLEKSIPLLEGVTELRNQIAHATPTLHGLLYRPPDRSSVEFYDIDALKSAEKQLMDAWIVLSQVLYHDGGIGVRRYVGGDGE